MKVRRRKIRIQNVYFKVQSEMLLIENEEILTKTQLYNLWIHHRGIRYVNVWN